MWESWLDDSESGFGDEKTLMLSVPMDSFIKPERKGNISKLILFYVIVIICVSKLIKLNIWYLLSAHCVVGMVLGAAETLASDIN